MGQYTMDTNNTFRYFHYGRLLGYPLGLGLTSVIVGGTLNRVMMVELGMPASLVGIFFALPLLISPVRVWLGYRSDAYPIWGLRREPYIMLGTLFTAVGVISATVAALQFQGAGRWIGAAVLLAFVIYGLGKNLASNTFEALLADKFAGEQRPRAVTFFKIAMFVGIIGGAIVLGKLLDPFTPEKLLTIVMSVMAAIFVFAVLGSLGQEPRTGLAQAASQAARTLSFRATIQTVVLGDPQIRLFFFFVMLTVLGTLAQDVLLEPYGALALGLTVGQTTRLTAIWGTGTVLAMALAGVWLIKQLGYGRVMRMGLLLGTVTFVGLILVGIWQSPGSFMGLVLLLGISTGLSSAGLLTAVIEFTTPARAGLLMGVWGLAHELGQALGSLLSGAVVDVVRILTHGNTLVAYDTVFILETVLLVTALFLSKRVNLAGAASLQGDEHGERKTTLQEALIEIP